MFIADVFVDVPRVLESLGIECDGMTRDGWIDVVCPLHPENKPSFSVSLEHGGWVCRHGDETGGLVSLVARVRGVSRFDAVRWAQRSVTQLSDSEVLLSKLLKRGHVDEDNAVLKWAERYDALPTSVMSEYWFERGFNAKTLRGFEVRYDPNTNSLLWPVRDENWNLIGFTERRVPPFEGAKYLYPKGFGRELFPMNMLVGDHAVLVEGPLDAMWLRQHGYPGIAVLGASITARQLSWLKGKVRKLTLALDNDEVGQTTQVKLVKQLSKTFSVKTVEIPPGCKDVQELSETGLRLLFEFGSLKGIVG